MFCPAPGYWAGTSIPQLWSMLIMVHHSCPFLRHSRSFFLERTQPFQGLYFGLWDESHILRLVEPQGWRKLFLCVLWLSAPGVLCVKGLGSTWKVKKSDHSLSAPFAFVRGKKKIPCLCQWLQALFSRGLSWGRHLVDDFSRRKFDHLIRHSSD